MCDTPDSFIPNNMVFRFLSSKGGNSFKSHHNKRIKGGKFDEKRDRRAEKIQKLKYSR